MDSIKTAREIGLFELARNISLGADSPQVCRKIEETMPMPGADFAPYIENVVDYLMQFGKRKLLLLSPEIALLENLATRGVTNVQVILAIPRNMEPEAEERLRNNIPENIEVQFLKESFFPELLTPADGMIVSFGYIAKDRLMVLPECYRMTESYGSFLGKRVFIPYVVRSDFTRFQNWMEVNPRKFSDVMYGGGNNDE